MLNPAGESLGADDLTRQQLKKCTQSKTTVGQPVRLPRWKKHHQAFQKLGQQAGAEIFINQDVAKGMSGITKYFDAKKLQNLTSQ